MSSIISIVTETTEVIDPIERKIHSLRNLKNGWLFGEGVPVTGAASEKAKELNKLAKKLNLRADVFPESGGGISIAFYLGDECVEISIDNEGTISYASREKGIGSSFEELESLEYPDDLAVSEMIKNLKGPKKCDFSGYSATDITTNAANDLLARVLQTLVVGEYQRSRKYVYI